MHPGAPGSSETGFSLDFFCFVLNRSPTFSPALPTALRSRSAESPTAPLPAASRQPAPPSLRTPGRAPISPRDAGCIAAGARPRRRDHCALPRTAAIPPATPRCRPGRRPPAHRRTKDCACRQHWYRGCRTEPGPARLRSAPQQGAARWGLPRGAPGGAAATARALRGGGSCPGPRRARHGQGLPPAFPPQTGTRASPAERHQPAVPAAASSGRAGAASARLSLQPRSGRPCPPPPAAVRGATPAAAAGWLGAAALGRRGRGERGGRLREPRSLSAAAPAVAAAAPRSRYFLCSDGSVPPGPLGAGEPGGGGAEKSGRVGSDSGGGSSRRFFCPAPPRPARRDLHRPLSLSAAQQSRPLRAQPPPAPPTAGRPPGGVVPPARGAPHRGSAPPASGGKEGSGCGAIARPGKGSAAPPSEAKTLLPARESPLPCPRERGRWRCLPPACP